MCFTSRGKQDWEFNPHQIHTARENEYLAFLKVTRSLKAAEKSCDRYAIIESVYENSQLWTVLMADLVNPGNTLSQSEKSGLISLAVFCINKGQQVLSRGGSVEGLIYINLRMIKGLRGETRP